VEAAARDGKPGPAGPAGVDPQLTTPALGAIANSTLGSLPANAFRCHALFHPSARVDRRHGADHG
jgi:hypothetical protein